MTLFFVSFCCCLKCELLTQTPGDGGTLIFSYICSFNQIWGEGSKILFSIWFWGYGTSKMSIIWDKRILLTFFGGHSYVFNGHFVRSRYRVWIFCGFIKCKIFFGIPDISDIYFWVKSRCWDQAYVSRKLESTPSLGHRQRRKWTMDQCHTNTFSVLFKSWNEDL